MNHPHVFYSHRFIKESLMMKRFLFAVAAVVCCSSSIFAQDIFFAFGSGAAATDAQALDAADGTTGQVNLYSRTGLALDGIQFGFEVNTDVVELTGGSAFDEEFNVIGGTRYNAPPLLVVEAGGGNYGGVNLTEQGLGSSVGELFDPGFDADAGGFLLATLDFDVVGNGTAVFNPVLFGEGFRDTDFIDITDSITFGTAALTVTGVEEVPGIPEPSSALLLAFGVAGYAARRRR